MSINLNQKWNQIQQLFQKEIDNLNCSLLGNVKQNLDNQIVKKNKKSMNKIDSEISILNDLVLSNNKLNLQVNWLLSKAIDYDYTKQQLNGYYSMIRISINLIELILKRLVYLNKKKIKVKQNLSELNLLINYFVFILNFMQKIFNENKESLFSKSFDKFAELNVLNLDEQAQQALGLIYGKYNIFWFSNSMQFYFKILRTMILTSVTRSINSASYLFSIEKAGKKLAFISTHSSLKSLKKSFNLLEKPFYNRLYFNVLHIGQNNLYKSKTLYFEVNSLFVIPSFNENLKDNLIQFKPGKSIQERKIRCRFITGCTKRFIRNQQNNSTKSNQINKNKCLLFHVHGGGFVISSPDSHEIYLRSWATKLNGVPILSVDYELRASYPNAIQDVLDLYLKIFLIEDYRVNEQKKYLLDTFGFVPENVILVGDSCGGNLILSLLCCLNDIKRNYLHLLTKSKLIMPFAVVPIYPVFDLRSICSPSKMISLLDPILNSSILMSMHGSYGGMFEKNGKFDPTLRWYVSENSNENDFITLVDKEIIKKFEILYLRFDTPYASPITYKYFADLNNVLMYLFVSQICPLIDDAIEMYNLWKGPKKIYSFTNIPHGFIQFSDLSNGCRKAIKQIVFSINNLIDEHCSKIN